MEPTDANRRVESRLGPFSGYETTAEVDENSGELRVYVYGGEQLEAGLTQEPSLTFTVTTKGELTIAAPHPSFDTFTAFKARGWADFARDADGKTLRNWGALRNPSDPEGGIPIRQMIPLLADVHARVRAWRMDDYVGLYWARSTGATGGLESITGKNGTAVYFNRAEGPEESRPQGRDFTPLADQTYADKLNDTLVDYGLGEAWRKAYEAVELPDAISGIQKAIRAAFGKDVRAVAPTAEQFDLFNGVHAAGEVYVSVTEDVGFVQVAGHELYHDIERTRPDLIRWYTEHARRYFKNFPEYLKRLNRLVQLGEGEYTPEKAESELLADFMGDSLTDSAFLQQLADSNPGKFKQFLTAVRLWLSKVIGKLRGLESVQYVNDVQALQEYLKQVLNAYANGTAISDIPTPANTRDAVMQGQPLFSRKMALLQQRRRKMFGLDYTGPASTITKAVVQVLRFDRLTTYLHDVLLKEKLGGLVPEKIKAGVVDRYGVPDEAVDARVMVKINTFKRIREAGTLVEKIATITRDESKILHAIMGSNDKTMIDYLIDRTTPEGRQFIDDAKALISQMTREAVDVGLVSPEVVARNANAYVHRSYKKYTELEAGKTEKSGRARAMRIMGDAYKGRGMRDDVPMDALKLFTGEWWARKLRGREADVALKGERFTRFERRAPIDDKTLGMEGIPERKKKGKLLEVRYWPESQPRPAWANDWDVDVASWEARFFDKKNRVGMWRDFCPAERQMLGEIDEVRYVVAKTIIMMAHDIEVAKYFKWVYEKYGKSVAPDGVEAIDGSESLMRVYKPDVWVRVPNSKIPGTGLHVYGDLAGKYLPGPMWNDIRQLTRLRSANVLPEALAGVIRLWKINKALALDTPIPTPSGWTTMGALKLGDKVFDERGQPCEVLQATETQHNHECYEVEFSDGTKIVADVGHLWFTIYHGAPGVRETRDILVTLKERTRGDNNHSIPVAGALALPDVELPVPPYALGLWLGDGRRDGALMSVGGEDADEIMRHLTTTGVECGPSRKDSRNNVVYFQIMTPGVNGRLDGRRRGESVQAKLRSLGVLGNKHIPPAYLRASEAQRQELLMGLMDSDGHITERGLCGFCTIDGALKDGMLELLRSLGYKPTATLYEARCNGKPATPAWRLPFKAYTDRPVFKLARKSARLQAPPETRQRSQTRQIVAVRAVPSVPVRCILVSSPSHLFLAGEGMVPTHNTALTPGVHVNNVMGNVMMAYFHDVLGRHVAKALLVMSRKSKNSDYMDVYRDFEASGATLGMYAHQEAAR